MKTTYFIESLFCILLMAFCSNCIAQTCLPGGITFSSQTQVNAFSTNYPTCTHILGNVTINLLGINDLTPLNNISQIGGTLKFQNPTNTTTFPGLSSLQTIGGNLEITGTNLTSLSQLTGLSNINTINGSLKISSNSELLNINGLTGLNFLGSSIDINTNIKLENISALSVLTSSVSNIYLTNNWKLINLNGLQNITNVSGLLRITDCNLLTNLSGLGGLTSVGTLQISENDGLTSLTGMTSLSQVDATGLTIENNSNSNFNSLDGLQGFKSFSGSVNIRQNGNLTSLTGLGNLESVGSLDIHDNNNLQNLAGLENLESITAWNGTPGDLRIYGNDLLGNLNALSNLVSSVRDLTIDFNNITNLSGIDNIASITGHLRLNRNDVLTNCGYLKICEHINGGGSNYVSNGLGQGNCRNAPAVQVSCLTLPPPATTQNVVYSASNSTVLDNYTVHFNEDEFQIISIDSDGQSIGNNVTISVTTVPAGASGATPLEGGYVTTPDWFVMNRYWQVENTSSFANPVAVRFYYTDQDFIDLQQAVGAANLQQETDMIIYKVTGNPHDPDATNYTEYTYGASATLNTWTNGVDINGNKYAEFLVNSFSGGSAGASPSGAGALPVEFMWFRVKADGKQALLSWRTASEINNDKFLLQHGTDGRSFHDLAQIPSKGNSQQENSYEYLHANPSPGINYYRLKQVDFDGQYEYSKIISIEIPNDKPQITITPNPNNGQFTLHLQNPKSAPVTLRLMDSWGRVVWVFSTEEEVTETHVDLNLAPGIYYLRGESNGSLWQEKVVVQ